MDEYPALGSANDLLAFSSYRTRVNSSRMDHMADKC